MFLQHLIQAHWQQPKTWLTPILLPLSWLFGHIVHRRRQGYLKHPERRQRLPVPVVVVGNLHAGGTGKTPIVQAIVRQLQQRGMVVGIISRGYGRSDSQVHVLNAHSTAHEAGDEPLMLYRSTRAPTAVAANRHQAGIALLREHPDVQIIIADDGLQHYRLARDYEIAVFPHADIGQAQHLLPHGKLREPLSRLNDVNAIIISQADDNTPDCPFRLPEAVLQTHSRIRIGTPYLLADPAHTLPTGYLKDKPLTALIAIARPERFLHSLASLGIRPTRTVILPDHATWQTADLPLDENSITTEKDAIKLPADPRHPIWVLPIIATLPDNLIDHLIAHCLPEHGKETPS